MTKAVILAGYNDKADSILQDKATYLIGGKMMIEYVIDALLKSGCIDEIAVIGNEEKLKSINSEVVELIPCKQSLVDNILLGINRFYGGQVLISTSDIPMITEEAIRDFIFKGQSSGADLCYSIITKEIMLNKYPDANRTFVKLRDGEFTGGNLFLLDTTKTDRYIEIGKKMLLSRKNPWEMCRLLGVSFLFKLLIGSLSICDIEKRVDTLMGIKGKAIFSDYPEVGNDVDKLEDLALAIKYMS